MIESPTQTKGNLNETKAKTASDLIIETVSDWPGVTVEPGPRGSTSFHFGEKREIAHLHGNHSAHFSFPRELSEQLREAGRVVDHPLGDRYRGLAARGLDTDEDIEDVIALMRINYDREVERDATPRR